MPRKVMATKAVKETAPMYGQEDCSAEPIRSFPSSEAEKKEGVVNDLEARQRERLLNLLLDALCIPLEENFAVCDVIKPGPAGGPFLSSLGLEGVGTLRIPLSEDDIARLHTNFERAAACARRCWQLDASKITSPELEADLITPVSMKAVEDQGCYAAVMDLDVMLDKLLLCDTGGWYSFQKQEQGQHSPFATSIVQVPTELGHTGGELLVLHKNIYPAKRYDCHMVSSLGFSFMVLFADCGQVQQQRFTSGTQGQVTCLIFDLVRSDALSEEAWNGKMISQKVGEAEAVLKRLLDGATTKLVIPLRHHFRDNEKLSFSALTGSDSIMVEVLKNCSQPLLTLPLCLVWRHQTGSAVRGPTFGEDSDEDSADELYNAKHHIIGDVEEESIETGNRVGLESTDAESMQALNLVVKDFVVRVGEQAFLNEPDKREFDLGGSGGDSTLEEWCKKTNNADCVA